MKRGLQTGFGAPIGAVDLGRIFNWGFDVVRLDVPLGRDPAPLLLDVAGHRCQPIFLVRFPDTASFITKALKQNGQHFTLELYDPGAVNSEPNGRVDALQFGKDVAASAKTARDLGFTGDIISGAASNVDAGSLAWLAQMIPALPPDVIVGVHRYPPDARPWSAAHFSSRDEEWTQLSAVLGTRPFALTECGFDQARHSVPWFRSWFGIFGSDWQRTDAELGSDIVQEFAYWETRGALYCCLFQIRDAVPPDAPFGILRADGSVKQPVVDAIAAWRRSTT